MPTAAAQLEDRVDGLELGADDYLGKPFAFAELVARVRALSRRAQPTAPVLRHGDLSVDRARHRANRGPRPLPLTFLRFEDRPSHDGFGLGLTIVASIAVIHGGVVTARPRDDGGLAVIVDFPSFHTSPEPPAV